MADKMNLKYRLLDFKIESFAIRRTNIIDFNDLVYDLEFFDVLNRADKWISISIILHAYTSKDKKVRFCSIETSTVFRVDNFYELLHEKHYPAGFITVLLSIAFSTTRGALSVKSTDSIPNGLLLPIIVPVKEVKKKMQGDNPAYLTNLAANHVELKLYEGAIAIYDKLLELNVDDSKSLFNRGTVKALNRDYQNALIDIDKSLKLNADYALAYSVKAEILTNLNDFQGAITNITKAIQLDPNDFGILFIKAKINYRTGQFDTALNDYDELLISYPKSADLLNERSNTLVKLGRIDEAETDIKKAIELNSDLDLAYATLGEIHLLKGDKKQFLKYLEQALEKGFDVYRYAEFEPYVEMMNDPEFKMLLDKSKA